LAAGHVALLAIKNWQNYMKIHGLTPVFSVSLQQQSVLPGFQQSKNSIVTFEKNRLTIETILIKIRPCYYHEVINMARKPVNNDMLEDDDSDIDDVDEQDQHGITSSGKTASNNMEARRLLEIRREERELNQYLYDMFDY
jgi:hypothetical protein